MTDPQTLLARLGELDRQTAGMEPTPDTWHSWISQVTAYTDSFLSEMQSGPAFRPHRYPAGAYADSFSLEGSPAPLATILEEMAEWVDQDGINPASGGHLGYIPGGGVLPAALGDFLAAVTNRYAGIFFANPGAVGLENFLIRWLAELFGFPSTVGGNLASGGSIANLIAITAAREALGIRSLDVPRTVIYGSSHMHHCLHKALRIAGLGETILREVPLDDHYRIQPQALQDLIASDRHAGLSPAIILASAGTTDTGSIDPLEALASIAKQENLWLHVDAAYGGFFQLVPSIRPLFKGIERADSLVVDPHKGLFLPYGTGAVLIREVQHLAASHHYQANYMQDAYSGATDWSPADLSPELTKHFRGLRMYLALKMFGLDQFRAALKEKLLLCQYFHQQVQQLGFETGPDPALSVTYFRWNPPEGDPNTINRELMAALHQDGRTFLSSTTLSGEIWIRLAVLSFRTKLRHIEDTLSMLTDGLAILRKKGTIV